MPKGSQVNAMAVELVPLDALHLDEENPRVGDVEAIDDSLTEFDQHRPVVVQRSTGKIIIGNHLFKAAQARGWTHLNVYYVDDDDGKAMRRGLADNAVGDRAEFDDEILHAVLMPHMDNPPPGFDAESLAALEAQFRASQEGEDDDFADFDDPAIDDGYVVFRFGAYKGRVQRSLYARFEEAYKAQQAGENDDVRLGDVLVRWLGVEHE